MFSNNLLQNLFYVGRATFTVNNLYHWHQEKDKTNYEHYLDSIFSNNLLQNLFYVGRATVTVNNLYHWHQEKDKTNYDAIFRQYVFE